MTAPPPPRIRIDHTLGDRDRDHRNAAGKLIREDHAVGGEISAVRDGERVGQLTAGRHRVRSRRGREDKVELALELDIRRKLRGVAGGSVAVAEMYCPGDNPAGSGDVNVALPFLSVCTWSEPIRVLP